MFETMRAVFKTKPEYGAFEVLDTPAAPLPSANEVRIKVESVGICGTDLSIYKWTETVAKEYNPPFPVIPGHEFAGIVDQVGNAVTHVKIGDKVAVNAHISCGQCKNCRKGRESICVNRPILGCHANGGLTQYITVRGKNVFRLPDHLPIYLGSLAEPLSVAVHALERVQDDEPPNEQVAAIVGCGTIGILQYIACKAVGFKEIVILGLNMDKDRLSLAESMGAKTINVEEDDIFQKMEQLTGQPKADVVFEVAGTDSSIVLAIDLANSSSKVALVGIAAAKTPIETTKLVFAEKDLIGCRAYNLSTWSKTVDIIGKIIPELEKIVTHRFSLDGIHDAIDLLMQKKCLKVVIEPWKTA